MSNPTRALLALALLLVSTPALGADVGETPTNLPRTDQLERVAVFPRGVRFTTATSLRPVQRFAMAISDDPTDLWCFQLGSVVRVGCAERTDIFLTQTTTLTWSTATYSGGNLNDPYGDSTLNNLVGPVQGRMLMDTVPAGGWVEYVIGQSEFYNDSKGVTGFRGGWCSGNTTTVGWPCRVSLDCGSGGTCNNPTTSRTPFCAFVLTKAVSTAGSCTVTNPR